MGDEWTDRPMRDINKSGPSDEREAKISELMNKLRERGSVGSSSLTASNVPVYVPGFSSPLSAPEQELKDEEEQDELLAVPKAERTAEVAASVGLQLVPDRTSGATRAEDEVKEQDTPDTAAVDALGEAEVDPISDRREMPQDEETATEVPAEEAERELKAGPETVAGTAPAAAAEVDETDETPKTTSGIGGSWSGTAVKEVGKHKPKVSTWGVFDRPADISKVRPNTATGALYLLSGTQSCYWGRLRGW